MNKQSKKCLMPTKNPFRSMTALSVSYNNQSSLNAINYCTNTQASKSLQKNYNQIRILLKQKRDLKHLQHTQNILIRENPNKSSDISLINSKIESVLGNYNKINLQSQKQKLISRQKIKWSKANKENKFKSIKQNKENKQVLIIQKNNKERQITTLTLRDINITNINYPLVPKKQEKMNKLSSTQYPVIPALLIPKPAKTTKSRQTQIKKQGNQIIILDGLPTKDYKTGSLSLELEQLQNSQSHIDTLLSTLEKDFLPRNTDYFVYNQQQIKVPKIFRKSKANNQMYKSCTQVHSKIKESSIEGFKSVIIEKSNMRRGSVSQSLSLIQRQLNNFLMGLKTQICFDSEFKKMKHWFMHCKIQDKWKKLEEQLRLNSLWVNELTMKVIFLFQNQEGTLYESLIRQEYSIKQLVITFRAAQQHWNEYILNKFDDKLLKGAGFTENMLDSSNKGYISIQDLIRFLHCKLKEFYYTRDLNMIYLRLKGGQKLHYEELMAKISVTFI